jgi:hypothetical protein
MFNVARIAIIGLASVATFIATNAIADESEIIKTVTTCEKFDDANFKADPNDLISAGSPALKEVVNEGYVTYGSASTTCFNDGKLGTGISELSEVVFDADGTWVTTFVLNSADAPKGYNISKINLYSGWPSIRTAQKFELAYATVDKPNEFISLGEFSQEESRPVLMCVSLNKKSGDLISGAIAVRFIFKDIGTTWREIDVVGTAAK